MAVIERKDLISDEAIQSPKVLAESYKELLVSLEQVKSVSAGYQKTASDSAKTTKELSEEERNLVAQKKALNQIQNQVAAQVAKQSEEYQKQVAVLNDLKNQQKQRQALGEKEAITVTAQTASIKELGAALNANRAAYASLRSESERNSTEGKTLLKVIQQQDAEYKNLKSSIGQNQDNVGNYEGALKSLKQELKAAKDQLVGIAATLGEDSQEFKEAAAKAGELSDKINDIQDSTKAVSGTPIENLGSSFGLLGEKVRGLDFKGAASAINGISNSAKNLTFKEATNGIGSFGSSLGGLGKALLTNPIFLIGSAITLISVAVYSLRDKLKPLEIAFDAIGGAVDFVIQKFKDFSDWLGISSFKIDDYTKKVVESSKKQIEAITEQYDRQIKIAESANEKTVQLEKDKWSNIITEANKAYSALLDKKAEHNGKLNEEDEKKFEEYKKIILDANTELTVIANKEHQDNLKRIDEQAKKRKEEADKALKELRARIEEEFQFQILIEQKERERAFNEKTNLDNRAKQALENHNKYLEGLQKEIEGLVIQEDLIEEGGTQYEEVTKKKLTAEEVLDNQISALRRKRIDEDAKGLQEILNIYSAFKNNLLGLFSNITAGHLQELDAQEQAEKDRANREIILAGGNVQAKEQIQADSNLRLAALEKKKREEQNKQSKIEKAANLVEAAIRTSLAVLLQLSGGDPISAIPRSILAGTLGAIEIAAIASKPLPHYEIGTENHPGGLAVVGEKGHELISTPKGLLLSPASETIVDLPKGSEVLTNKETMQVLAMAGLSASELRNQASFSDQRIVGKLEGIEAAVKKSKADPVNYARVGAIVYESRKESDTFTRKIRALSMGDWL